MKVVAGIGIGIVIIAVATSVILFKVWLFGSLVTSGVKAISGSCGQTYGIEGKIISGDWFCPSSAKAANNK